MSLPTHTYSLTNNVPNGISGTILPFSQSKSDTQQQVNCQIVPILLGVLGSYVVAACFGQVDFTSVKEAAEVLGWFSRRYSTVTTMPRVVFAFGEKVLSAVPFIMPLPVT